MVFGPFARWLRQTNLPSDHAFPSSGRVTGDHPRFTGRVEKHENIQLGNYDMPSSVSSSTPVDPCLAPPSFSLERFMLFLPIFLTMTVGSALLLIFLADRPLGIQLASLICYTSAVALYTFSANRGMPRYLFSCPVVKRQLPRLAQRHVAFVSVLLILLTAALKLRPHLPGWWLVASGAPKSMPPFTITLLVLSAALALAQILTNRSLLQRVHIEDADVHPGGLL